jgi:hypothetical protein
MWTAKDWEWGYVEIGNHRCYVNLSYWRYVKDHMSQPTCSNPT